MCSFAQISHTPRLSCLAPWSGCWAKCQYFFSTYFSEWAHKSLSKGSLGIGTSPRSQEYTRLLAKLKMQNCATTVKKTNLAKFLVLFGRESKVCIFIVEIPVSTRTEFVYWVHSITQCTLIKRRVVEKGYIGDTQKQYICSSIVDTF